MKKIGVKSLPELVKKIITLSSDVEPRRLCKRRANIPNIARHLWRVRSRPAIHGGIWL